LANSNALFTVRAFYLDIAQWASQMPVAAIPASSNGPEI
jgi:hypothetical protein